MIQLPPRLPDPTMQWFDPRTGRPTREFYQYLRDLDATLRKLVEASNDHDTRITELESP